MIFNVNVLGIRFEFLFITVIFQHSSIILSIKLDSYFAEPYQIDVKY